MNEMRINTPHATQRNGLNGLKMEYMNMTEKMAKTITICIFICQLHT